MAATFCVPCKIAFSRYNAPGSRDQGHCAFLSTPRAGPHCCGKGGGGDAARHPKKAAPRRRRAFQGVIRRGRGRRGGRRRPPAGPCSLPAPPPPAPTRATSPTPCPQCAGPTCVAPPPAGRDESPSSRRLGRGDSDVVEVIRWATAEGQGD